jgi:hypothetical protein
MAGRRSLQSSSISQLTSQPETIPSCYRRSRHAEFQPLSGRHALSRTTYLFTDFSHVSTVPSVAPTRDGSESLNLASPGRLKQNRDGRSFRPDGYTEVRSLEQGHVGSLDLIPETDDRERNVNCQVLGAGLAPYVMPIMPTTFSHRAGTTRRPASPGSARPSPRPGSST